MVGHCTMETQMSISPAATIVLTRAAQHPDRPLEFHRRLPIAARIKMIDALLRDAMIAKTKGDYRYGDGAVLVEDAAAGLLRTTLALTDVGFCALNLDPPGSEPGAGTSADDAATTASDAAEGRPWPWPTPWTPPRPRPRPPPAPACAPRKPREGTKQQAVLTLLRCGEGANIAQIVAATAAARHTVRGFLANLQRKDITVEVRERIRQLGPGSAGAKSSCSIYHIADSG